MERRQSLVMYEAILYLRKFFLYQELNRIKYEKHVVPQFEVWSWVLGESCIIGSRWVLCDIGVHPVFEL